MKNFLFLNYVVLTFLALSFVSCKKENLMDLKDKTEFQWRSGSLTELTQNQFQNLTITPFDTDIDVDIEGEAIEDITIEIHGWGPDSFLVFTITHDPYINTAVTSSNVCFDSLNVDITSSSFPYIKETHWILGWQCMPYLVWSLHVEATNRKTGTWVFKKAKS